MNEAIEIGLKCAIIGVAFATVEPTPFGFWFDRLLSLESSGTFGRWISKPLGGCSVCLSGQLALWYSLISTQFSAAMYGQHILAACSGVLFATILNKVYQWTQQ